MLLVAAALSVLEPQCQTGTGGAGGISDRVRRDFWKLRPPLEDQPAGGGLCVNSRKMVVTDVRVLPEAV